MDKYIKQHWDGELSLARSYWLNSVVITNVAIIVSAFALGVVWGIIASAIGIPMPPKQFWDVMGYIISIPFVIWSIGGTWKAADKYKAVKDGVMNWGGLAQVCMSIGVLKFVFGFIALFV